MHIPNVDDAWCVPACSTEPSEALYMVLCLARFLRRFRTRGCSGFGLYTFGEHVAHFHGVSFWWQRVCTFATQLIPAHTVSVLL